MINSEAVNDSFFYINIDIALNSFIILHILKLTSCLALFSGFFFFQKTDCCEFYVLLTLHLGIFFVNNQLDAQFLFSCMFISILYMFRAAMCPSSGKLIVSIRHLVHVTLYR